MISVFAGCAGNNEPPQGDTTPTPTTGQPQATDDPDQQDQPDGEFSYPMETDVTLTYWLDLNGNVSTNFVNFGDTPLAKELEKRTGIKVEYQHPAAGTAADTFGIMAASNDFPDIVEYNWITGYAGGPELALSNNLIVELSDKVNDYAPNLMKTLEENKEFDKAVKSDSGAYYAFPFISGDEMLLTTYGPAIRLDWLEKLNLPLPVTIDDWHKTLTAFKDELGASAPIFLPYDDFARGVFINAWGIKNGFHVEDGQVKYGPAEPVYEDFLITMNKWYSEDLIDKNFASADGKVVDANILNGNTGARVTYPGSGIGRYVPALKENDPNADLGPTTFPVLKEGERSKISSRSSAVPGNGFAAISTNCENVEEAMRLLDYGYSEEGNLLFNFGIDGTSFEMVDGYPTMTDEVLANETGMTVGQAWAQYARAPYNGPFVQRQEYIVQYNPLQQQKDCFTLWSDTDAADYMMPAISVAKEDSAEYSRLITDLQTYVDEFSLRVIMGAESIDSFDEYTAQLKAQGIERILEIQQAALDNYNNR